MPGTRQTHARPRPIHTTLAVLFGALACAFALALAPTTGSVRARRAQAPAAQAISRHQPQGTTQTTTQAVTFDSWNADSASLAKLKAFVDAYGVDQVIFAQALPMAESAGTIGLTRGLCW